MSKAEAASILAVLAILLAVRAITGHAMLDIIAAHLPDLI